MLAYTLTVTKTLCKLQGFPLRSGAEGAGRVRAVCPAGGGGSSGSPAPAPGVLGRFCAHRSADSSSLSASFSSVNVVSFSYFICKYHEKKKESIFLLALEA